MNKVTNTQISTSKKNVQNLMSVCFMFGELGLIFNLPSASEEENDPTNKIAYEKVIEILQDMPNTCCSKIPKKVLNSISSDFFKIVKSSVKQLYKQS